MSLADDGANEVGLLGRGKARIVELVQFEIALAGHIDLLCAGPRRRKRLYDLQIIP